MQISARILYPVVRSLDSGFYCWVVPDEESLLKFSALRKICSAVGDFSYENSTELHATVMYHTGDLPADPIMPEDQPMACTVTEVVAWDDHEGRKILVALLDSPDLQRIHSELRAQGFRHSFDDFAPHVTLGKFKSNDSMAARALSQKMTRVIREVDFSLNFQPKLFGDSLT